MRTAMLSCGSIMGGNKVAVSWEVAKPGKRFHAGDTVYIKPLGLVGVIASVFIVLEVDGRMHIAGYEMGSDLNRIVCAAEWLELVEGGEASELADWYEASLRQITAGGTQ